MEKISYTLMFFGMMILIMTGVIAAPSKKYQTTPEDDTSHEEQTTAEAASPSIQQTTADTASRSIQQTTDAVTTSAPLFKEEGSLSNGTKKAAAQSKGNHILDVLQKTLPKIGNYTKTNIIRSPRISEDGSLENSLNALMTCDGGIHRCFTDMRMEFPWKRTTGSTYEQKHNRYKPTTDTTSRSRYGYFWFTDLAGHSYGHMAGIESHFVAIYQTQPVCLRFWMYANGVNVGNLLVLVRYQDNGGYQQVLIITGSQGTEWKKHQVDINPRTSLQILFLAMSVNGQAQGAIAVDDVTLSRGSCTNAGQWKPWSDWGSCSPSCGHGAQTRTRECPDSLCQGSGSEVRACHRGACPSPWSSWSLCSATCGAAVRSRTRSCHTTGCAMYQTQSCQVWGCYTAVWGAWGGWSPCSVTCGTGRHTRVRSCVYGQCQGHTEEYYNCEMPACYTGRRESACGATPVTLTGTTGHIFSPGFQQNDFYDDMSRCFWQLTAAKGQEINLQFLVFLTEYNQDKLTLFAGTSTSDHVLGEFSGQLTGYKMATKTWQILFQFTSDGATVWRGFDIQYQVIGTPSATGNTWNQNNRNGAITQTETRCGTRPLDTAGSLHNILGGSLAAAGSWPWMAAVLQIRYPTQLVCGATILSKRFILTAAHCFIPPNQGQPKSSYNVRDVFVMVGSVDIAGGTRYDVESFHVPDSYWQAGLEYDIALLKLKTEIQYTTYVAPLCLPDKPPEPGVKCAATGWGVSNFPVGPPSRYLKQVLLEVTDQSLCTSHYGHSVNKHLCAGYNTGQRGIYRGDSGGALVCPKRGGFYVAGVSSFVHQSKAAPDVFSNVYHHVGWIKQILSST